jgi:hypothetical protein
MKPDEIILKDEQDALDLIANCHEQGEYKVVINARNIAPAFFDLKTGLCGKIVQKFINYNCTFHIIGDFTNIESKSLRDFIFECNKGTLINFINE